jgi:hypothetical protein
MQPTELQVRVMSVDNEFFEKRDDGYWMKGSRVSLVSIVRAYLRGQTPETIAKSFPMLTLAQVYAALAFYYAHRAEIDEVL